MSPNTFLKKARRERGLTQVNLAEQLHVGVQTVSSWERGKRAPQPEVRKRLCEILGKSPEELGLPPLDQGLRHSSTQKDHVTYTVVLSAEEDNVFPEEGSERRRDVAEPSQTAHRNTFAYAYDDVNRQRLLTRVHERWIKGVFEESLYHSTLLVVPLQERPDVLEDPWQEVFQESPLPSRSLPPGTRITQVYDQADGELLILGEPGSGKTTLLLELARHEIARARHYERYPLPIYFNLASWAERQLPLEKWLVEEINTKYRISPKLAQTWIEAEHITLLLDGLDDVGPEYRTACIQEINTYRQKYGLAPVVVCCRSADYLAQPARLALNKSVVVKALTTEQIDEFVALAGQDLAILRLTLQRDAALREMASTPLMLNTLAIAYQGVQMEEVLTDGVFQIQRHMIFAKYVERLIERGGAKTKTYTSVHIKQYLTWLARHLQAHNQTEFHIERLQPDWLESNREQHRYQRTVIRLVTVIQCIVGGALAAWLKGGLKNGVVGSGNGILGLFGGGTGNSMLGWMAPGIGGGSQGGASLILILSIVIWLVSILVGSPSLPTLTPRAIWHGLGTGLRTGLKFGLIISPFSITLFTILGGLMHGISYGLGIGFFLAMLIGLLSGLGGGLRYQQEEPPEKVPFKDRLVDGLTFGTGGGLSFAIVELLLQVNHQSTIIYSFIAALFYFLAFGFGGGTRLFTSLGKTIQPAEIVTWSWKQMAQDMGNTIKKSLLVALVTLASVGVIIAGITSLFFVDPGYGLHYGLVFGTISGLIVGIAGILTSMLQSGWSSEILADDQHTIPNEGIARSGRNALLGACIFAPIGGIASGLATGIGFGLLGQLSTWPVMAKAFAVMIAIQFFVIFTIAHGGIAWIEHYTLRWYLWKWSRIPRNYVDFLNRVTSHALMRNVGGGYMFTHRLLLEYFAQLAPSLNARSVSVLSEHKERSARQELSTL
ncbi:hypothetical protein KSC_003890 [Ktedonobacter sp. SOSP1-52]|uniref:helix-turn-helix domain-containing protein n=1 Tax=Ktedonobacter sp. SOSP1-52 TaxID=2778366 RepID=UPI001915185D|nr:helix-turn-helix domain-containing protein [Ktedonobacter sp. SOSP1-52]GHO61497.1 hypothetical protein KSC_003890 [Ktedonobacter sp. SOSP1-52]